MQTHFAVPFCATMFVYSHKSCLTLAKQQSASYLIMPVLQTSATTPDRMCICPCLWAVFRKSRRDFDAPHIHRSGTHGHVRTRCARMRVEATSRSRPVCKTTFWACVSAVSPFETSMSCMALSTAGPLPHPRPQPQADIGGAIDVRRSSGVDTEDCEPPIAVRQVVTRLHMASQGRMTATRNPT